MKIIAVVVTYNRKELLVECLKSIYKQSYNVAETIIIDNASTDGTYNRLQEENLIKDSATYVKLKNNTGGAGGFYEGIKIATLHNADWIWVMDDDTIPTEVALESLLNAEKIVGSVHTSFFASTVYGEKNETMNLPQIDLKSNDSYPDWYRFLEKGLVKIKCATFVSLLINASAVKECGLPCKDYFIWGDDIEYTLRLTKYYGPAYFVGSSKVIHKRKDTRPISLITENNCNRIRLQSYYVRNTLINAKTYSGRKQLLKLLIKYNMDLLKIIFKGKNKIIKIKSILKGIVSYFIKAYNYKAFRNRLSFYGQEEKAVWTNK